jgi:hypothetical protein
MPPTHAETRPGAFYRKAAPAILIRIKRCRGGHHAWVNGHFALVIIGWAAGWRAAPASAVFQEKMSASGNFFGRRVIRCSESCRCLVSARHGRRPHSRGQPLTGISDQKSEISDQ